VLELGEEKRTAGIGEVEVGRGPRPFIGAGGRWTWSGKARRWL
jgi:hypothetical protein